MRLVPFLLVMMFASSAANRGEETVLLQEQFLQHEDVEPACLLQGATTRNVQLQHRVVLNELPFTKEEAPITQVPKPQQPVATIFLTNRTNVSMGASFHLKWNVTTAMSAFEEACVGFIRLPHSGFVVVLLGLVGVMVAVICILCSLTVGTKDRPPSKNEPEVSREVSLVGHRPSFRRRSSVGGRSLTASVFNSVIDTIGAAISDTLGFSTEVEACPSACPSNTPSMHLCPALIVKEGSRLSLAVPYLRRIKVMPRHGKVPVEDFLNKPVLWVKYWLRPSMKHNKRLVLLSAQGEETALCRDRDPGILDLYSCVNKNSGGLHFGSLKMLGNLGNGSFVLESRQGWRLFLNGTCRGGSVNGTDEHSRLLVSARPADGGAKRVVDIEAGVDAGAVVLALFGMDVLEADAHRSFAAA